MDAVWNPLRQYAKGRSCHIFEEDFIRFVVDGPFEKLSEVPYVFQINLVHWALEELGMETFGTWLYEAEALVPGFMEHPHISEHTFAEFDGLGIFPISNHTPCTSSYSPVPKASPSCSPLPSTFPSGPSEGGSRRHCSIIQPLLEEVVRLHPELAGKSMVEVWCDEILERRRHRAQWMKKFQLWYMRTLKARDGEGAVLEQFRKSLPCLYLGILVCYRNHSPPSIAQDLNELDREHLAICQSLSRKELGEFITLSEWVSQVSNEITEPTGPESTQPGEPV